MQTKQGREYETKLICRLTEKFYNVDWEWYGDGEWDERRLGMTLLFDPDNRDKKRELLMKCIQTEGYGI